MLTLDEQVTTVKEGHVDTGWTGDDRVKEGRVDGVPVNYPTLFQWTKKQIDSRFLQRFFSSFYVAGIVLVF